MRDSDLLSIFLALKNAVGFSYATPMLRLCYAYATPMLRLCSTEELRGWMEYGWCIVDN